MIDLKQNNMYEDIGNRRTRASDKYIFDPDTPKLGVYAKSPYYVGVNMWLKLPVHIQNLNSK